MLYDPSITADEFVKQQLRKKRSLGVINNFIGITLHVLGKDNSY